MITLLGLAALGCAHARVVPASTRSALGYTVVRSIAHDTAAHTQGLVYWNGVLYESTGRFGKSQVRRLDTATGKVEAALDLPGNEYGEGLALFDGLLYQVTWRNQLAYVYDPRTLSRVRSIPYAGEAWGLTTDGTSLILSDGSAKLRYLNPTSLSVEHEVQVRDRGWAIADLNELEYVRGEILANVLLTDQLVRIDPRSGTVLGWIDLSGLAPRVDRTLEQVLNGIAYDPRSGHLFVTGKGWPKVFEIRLTPRAQPAVVK